MAPAMGCHGDGNETRFLEHDAFPGMRGRYSECCEKVTRGDVNDAGIVAPR